MEGRRGSRLPTPATRRPHTVGGAVLLLWATSFAALGQEDGVGACCVAGFPTTADCELLTETACRARAGVYFGVDTDCASVDCSNGGCRWVQTAQRNGSDAAPDDGVSVSVHGNTLVSGALLHDATAENAGAVYVFGRQASDAGPWGETAKLTVADGAVQDLFGKVLAIDGDTLVVGAPGHAAAGDAAGAAYVFERSTTGAWREVAKLTATDADRNDRFAGESLELDGDRLVVGVPADDDLAVNAGSAYVFERNAGGLGAWGQVVKLTAPDPEFGNNFGWGVAVSGDTVVVGAHRDRQAPDAGAVYVFERGGLETGAGSTGGWRFTVKLQATPLRPWERMGGAVAIDGDVLVVGASGADDLGFNTGAAYVFERVDGPGGPWVQVVRLTARDAARNSRFGSGVAIVGGTIAVAASHDDALGTNGGAVYLFERNGRTGGQWVQTAKLAGMDTVALDEFGTAVSLSGNIVAIGAPGAAAPGPVYVFERRGCCGDGVRDGGEACDDGNLDDGDGCSADCRSELSSGGSAVPAERERRQPARR